MKVKFTLLTVLVAFAMSTFAQQIPNAGFENWATPFAPDSWSTFEEVFGAPLGLVSKDTVDKVQGNASVKIKTDSIPAGPQGNILLSGLLSLGTINYSPSSQPPFSFSGVPFAFKPDTMFFSFKYVPAGADTCALQVILSTGGTVTLAGGIDLPATGGNWVNLFIPLTADLAQIPTPDSLVLQFFSSTGNGVQGSTLNVDAIRFGYVSIPTVVEDINNNVQINVFPNPSTDFVNINISEALPNASVMVYNMEGRVMTHEFIGGNSHTLQTASWPAGIYQYAIISNSKAVAKGQLSVAK